MNGHWYVDHECGAEIRCSTSGRIVCEVQGDVTDHSHVALIAAAPELLEALRGMLAIEDSVTQGQERELRAEWLPKARAALAKAEGADSKSAGSLP